MEEVDAIHQREEDGRTAAHVEFVKKWLRYEGEEVSERDLERAVAFANEWFLDTISSEGGALTVSVARGSCRQASRSPSASIGSSTPARRIRARSDGDVGGAGEGVRA
jgi:hypothetical protein